MRPRTPGAQASSLRALGHAAAAGSSSALEARAEMPSAAGMAGEAAGPPAVDGAVVAPAAGGGAASALEGGAAAAAGGSAAAAGRTAAGKGGSAGGGDGAATAAGAAVSSAPACHVEESLPLTRGGAAAAAPVISGDMSVHLPPAGGSRAAAAASPAAACSASGGSAAAGGRAAGGGAPSPARSCSSSLMEGDAPSPCSSAVSTTAQKHPHDVLQQQEQQQSFASPPLSLSSSLQQQQRGKTSSLERGGLGLVHLPMNKIAKTGAGKGHFSSHKGSSSVSGSKVKRGGKQISSARINDSYAVSLPNALPLKQVVWAKDAMSGVWRLCSIVHARARTSRPAPPSRSSLSRSASPSVFTGAGAATSTCTTPQQQNADSSAGRGRELATVAAAAFTLSTATSASSSSSITSDATAAALPGPEDYDYYVHFLGFDRRLDQWKTWEEVREDESELPPNEPVVKEVHDSSDDEHAGMDEDYLREHEEATKVKSIHRIRMGRYSVDTWYFSPYPKQYQNVHTLHICEFCLAFFKEETELARHMRFCECRHPPGNEIYRDKGIAMFEVDGNHCRVYCENLCFLSKLFLDHKTLRHPVSLFLFYVMTEIDEKGYHITGYFSKEKYSKNNVSCILTLPQHQRKGYGKFLINFSYSLSRAESKCGTPERPLSDLGKASYMAFWTEMILASIVGCGQRISVQKVKFLKEASGRPSRPVKPNELHWVPYDRYLMPFEYNPQA